MRLTNTINLIEALWVLTALSGLVYSLKLRHDARQDVAARHLSGTNSGREDLAQMLVTTAALNAIGFLGFLLAGLVAMTIPSSPAITPRSYGIQLLLVGAQLAMAVSVWHKQRVRTRVFVRDRDAEIARLAVVAELATEHLDLNTEALGQLTDATREHTQTLRGQDEYKTDLDE